MIGVVKLGGEGMGGNLLLDLGLSGGWRHVEDFVVGWFARRGGGPGGC